MLAGSTPAEPATLPITWRRHLALYAELTKSRLSALVVMTTAVGFAMCSSAPFDLWRFCWTLIGTALAAGGTNGLNQWVEVARDRRMLRTRRRPLPSGELSERSAFGVSLAMSVVGPVALLLFVNALTAGLAALTTLLYLFVYTPLKTRSPSCTLVGAVCGAIPPMMGCSAATGSLDYRAWLLFITLFIWQIPHFLSLAWMYRDDYERGGFKMMPVLDRSGRRTCRMIVLYALALLPLVVAVTMSGMAGWIFVAGGLGLGGWFLARTIRLYRERSDATARKVFLASLIYLPAVLVLMVIDRGPAGGGFPW